MALVQADIYRELGDEAEFLCCVHQQHRLIARAHASTSASDGGQFLPFLLTPERIAEDLY